MENICSSSLFSWISRRNWSDNSLITLDWMTEKGWVGGHCHNNFHLWSEKLDWGGLVFCSAGSVLESQLSLEQKWLGSTLLFPPPKETVIFALWTQPSPKYPVHSRGVLCCYVTTFSNCTSCRAQTVLCATFLVALSAPCGCLSILGSDLHFPISWIHICCPTTLLFVSSSFRSKRLKQTPQTVHTGWGRVSLFLLKSFEGCCLHSRWFFSYSQSSFLSRSFFFFFLFFCMCV